MGFAGDGWHPTLEKIYVEDSIVFCIFKSLWLMTHRLVTLDKDARVRVLFSSEEAGKSGQTLAHRIRGAQDN